MTKAQCQKFLAAVEAAGIKAWEYITDVPCNLFNDGENFVAKPIYDLECIVAFRGGKTNMSHPLYDNNINLSVANFGDVHEIRTAGDYTAIKKFVESIGLDLTDDEFKILLKIDKSNYDIKPITGDYVSGFKYLSSKEYDALSPEEKAAYDAKKAAYEKAKADYIPANQAAMITL